MNEIPLEKVDAFTSGNFKHTPQCLICHKKNCYIIVDQKLKKNSQKYEKIGNFWQKRHKKEEIMRPKSKTRYFYSKTCKNCVCDISRNYITDLEVVHFIDNRCVSQQKCDVCKIKSCFIRINEKGKYFTKKCSSCIGVRNL